MVKRDSYYFTMRSLLERKRTKEGFSAESLGVVLLFACFKIDLSKDLGTGQSWKVDTKVLAFFSVLALHLKLKHTQKEPKCAP